MQDHEARVTILESRVQKINYGMGIIHKNMVDMMLRMQAQEALNKFRKLESDTRRFMRGWETLFEHRLSPLLVNPKTVKNVMRRLNDAALKHSLVMISTEQEDLYQFSTSHLITKTGQLIILVHCPLVSTSGLLNVYRYVGIPMRPPQIDAHIMANPTYNILAIGRDQSNFRVMNEQELNECSLTKGKQSSPIPVYTAQL